MRYILRYADPHMFSNMASRFGKHPCFCLGIACLESSPGVPTCMEHIPLPRMKKGMSACTIPKSLRGSISPLIPSSNMRCMVYIPSEPTQPMGFVWLLRLLLQSPSLLSACPSARAPSLGKRAAAGMEKKHFLDATECLWMDVRSSLQAHAQVTRGGAGSWRSGTRKQSSFSRQLGSPPLAMLLQVSHAGRDTTTAVLPPLQKHPGGSCAGTLAAKWIDTVMVGGCQRDDGCCNARGLLPWA